MIKKVKFMMMGLSTLCLPACRGESDSRPPYQLGEPRAIREGEARPKPGPPPAITIIRPTPHARFKPWDKIDCEIRVEVPEGGREPEVVNVSIKSGKLQVAGGLPASPVSREGRTTTLAIRLDSPRRPGAYEIEAEGLQSLFIEPKGGAGQPRAETTRHYSPRVKIEVRP